MTSYYSRSAKHKKSHITQYLALISQIQIELTEIQIFIHFFYFSVSVYIN